MNTAWLHLPFSLLYLLLIFRFFIAIFEPGIPQLDILFQLVNPVLPMIDGVIGLAILPIILLVNLVKSFLPGSLLFWFPETPAGHLFYTCLPQLAKVPYVGGLFQSFKTLPYSEIFPGTFQWVLPLTFLFWSMFEKPLILLVKGVCDLAKPRND